MKKAYWFIFFSALMLSIGCNRKLDAPSKEEFFRLEKKLVENEARISHLEDELEVVRFDLQEVQEIQEKHTTKKEAAVSSANTQNNQKWVDWAQLTGGSRKYYKGEPYTGGFTQYFSDRSKQLTGYFVNGYRSGKWTYFNKNGSVKDIRYY